MALVSVTAAPLRSETPANAAAVAKAGTLTDLVPDFATLADATSGTDDAARITAFHAHFDPLLPGYFRAKDDQRIAAALRDFPAERAKILTTTATFRTDFAKRLPRFRAAFPGFTLSDPVYLIHSVDQQDGGTRDIAGRSILVFGADVIARLHDETTMGPFLDHELFHVYHERYFPLCDRLWCSVWEEGMAVYVASRLNPGASDRALLLTQPRPIRAEVDPRLREAMCRLRARFDSKLESETGEFLLGRANTAPFPPRYGYYLGYLIARAAGRTIPLAHLAKLPPTRVRLLMRTALDSYGPCHSLKP